MDVALAIDADGVHVGQSDMPCDVTRKLVGPDKIVGVSAATIDEAKKLKKMEPITSGQVQYFQLQPKMMLQNNKKT